ncbi:MAG: LysM domain-containing protein [Verrucomicrobiales bacterium]
MFGPQLKIIIAVIAAGVLGATLFGAYYLYQKTYVPEQAATQQIREYMTEPPPRPDPGKAQFEQAMALLQSGELAAAHDKLLHLMRTYTDSSRYEDARRIVGEINVDLLFSPVRTPGKATYTVEPGDALAVIARRHNTTVSYIMRANARLGTTIHPGDKLMVCALDFTAVAELGKKRLTRCATATSSRIPHRGLRASLRRARPVFRRGENKTAWSEGSVTNFTKPDYNEAEKWIVLDKKGMVISPPPPEDGKKRSLGGIYVSPEDSEELFTLLRDGASVKVVE